MDPGSAGVIVSGVLAVGVLIVAGLLTWKQHLDRQRRPPSDDPLDARYYARQDRRRYRGAVILALVALGVGIGSRIDIRADRESRILFLIVWMAVFLLLIQLLLMAFLDLWSTRRFARRKRRQIAEERRKELKRAEDRANADHAHDAHETPPEGEAPPGRSSDASDASQSEF